MLAILSPAKKLDFSPLPPETGASWPDFQEDAVALARVARGLGAERLGALMDLSENLATLTRERFQAFAAEPPRERVKQAIFAFAGDTYQGLKADTFDAGDLAYAQDHLRILSGLYGLLRPLDLIQPYRLEMGTRLATGRGKTLYDWWGDRLARALDAASEGAPIVNLASQEYFRAVDRKALASPVIEVDFKEERNGTLKTISFFAKRARGAMARHIVRSRARTMADLQAFALEGYRFRSELSTDTRLVFSRPST